MSEELAVIEGIAVTSFFGGQARGRCIQLTPVTDDYAQLTESEVRELVRVLQRWLADFPQRASRGTTQPEATDTYICDECCTTVEGPQACPDCGRATRPFIWARDKSTQPSERAAEAKENE